MAHCKDTAAPFLFAALLGAAPAVFAADSRGPAPIDPALLATAAEAPQTRQRVLVQMAERADLADEARITDWNARGWAVYRTLRSTADRTQAEAMAVAQSAVRSGHAGAVKSLWIVNALALDADLATLHALARAPGVGRILPPAKIALPETERGVARAVEPQAVEWGVMKIRAPEVWSTYGTRGAGTVVAGVDTGVQWDHPALIGQYRGNLGGGNFNHNYNWYDPTGVFATVPGDDNGHGSHTMGTEVGTDGASNEIGVAPGAKWIAAYGCCPSNEALLEAQQFILAPTDLTGANPDPTRRPHVVNQSWGGPGGSEIFEEVVAALRASGIFPSFSAGNNGGAAADGCGRLGSPGDNPSSFNVGSTDVNDNIASSSSRGPNPITGRIGPEVSAPGVSVRSSVPGNAYSNFSGTSMASPHVAGAVALLIAVEPKLTGQIEQIEELLRKTAVGRTTSQVCGGVPGSQIPNNSYGWGRIDVKAAADMVWQSGHLEGMVTQGGQPRADAVVTFTRLGKTLTTRTGADGRYRVVAGAGNWDVGASYEGQNSTATGVAVAQNGTTTQDFTLGAPATFTVTGTITQSGGSTPVPAMLLVRNSDTIKPVWADPATGNYSLQLPAGSWDVQIQHPGYQTATQTVNAGGTSPVALTPRTNYQCLDNTQAGGPTYAWTDISSGSTALNLDDDASSTAITLPGTFTYFGTDFTTVRINSNGFLFFGTTNFTTANMVLPFEGRPNNDVMALGEDLNPALGAQGTVYHRTTGSQLIVQYHQVQHWINGFPETFQIILDTATDTITYQYHTLSQPEFTTAGVEDSTGTVGQLYSFRNSKNLVAGRAVRFTPATGTNVNWGCDHAFSLTVSDQTDPVPTGAPLRYALKWNLTGFGGAPAAQLAATIPANMSFVSASGGVTPVGNTVTWDLGSLRPRASGTVYLTLTPVSGSNATINAQIVDAANELRSASETTTFSGEAALFRDGFE